MASGPVQRRTLTRVKWKWNKPSASGKSRALSYYYTTQKMGVRNVHRKEDAKWQERGRTTCRCSSLTGGNCSLGQLISRLMLCLPTSRSEPCLGKERWRRRCDISAKPGWSRANSGPVQDAISQSNANGSQPRRPSGQANLRRAPQEESRSFSLSRPSKLATIFSGAV